MNQRFENSFTHSVGNLPWLAAALLVLVLAGGSCSPPPGVAPPPPVVIVALDGLSWQVADPLIEQGEMSTLAGLAQAGASGRLATHRPTWTPVLFTTMATGKLPDEHGINTFVSNEGIPLTSNLRRVPALWNILSHRDHPTLFLGWPVTWPAEEVLGEMITDRWHKTEQQQVHPAAVAREIAPLLRDFRSRTPGTPGNLQRLEQLATVDRVSPYLHGSFEGTGAAAADSGTSDRLVQLTRKKVSTGLLWNVTLDSEVKLPLFLQRLKAVRPRLAAIYFNATDMAQHFFGGADRAGDSQPEPNPAGRKVIEEIYRVYDRLLGRLVQEVRAVDGYENCSFVVLSDHGIDLACGTEARLQPPDDLPDEHHLTHYRSLITGQQTGPPGVVITSSGDGWFRLCFPPATDMAARSRILNRLDLAGCHFHPDDVYLYFVHEEAPPGVVVISGGYVRPGQTVAMSVADVTPTVLSLLRLPYGEDMAGERAGIRLDLPGHHKPALLQKITVPTHGAARPTADGEQPIASPEDQQIREELQALGYIE